METAREGGAGRKEKARIWMREACRFARREKLRERKKERKRRWGDSRIQHS